MLYRYSDNTCTHTHTQNGQGATITHTPLVARTRASQRYLSELCACARQTPGARRKSSQVHYTYICHHLQCKYRYLQSPAYYSVGQGSASGYELGGLQDLQSLAGWKWLKWHHQGQCCPGLTSTLYFTFQPTHSQTMLCPGSLPQNCLLKLQQDSG